jgi:hypothetical protein
MFEFLWSTERRHRVRRLLLLAGLLSAAPARAQPLLETALPPAMTDYASRLLTRMIETTREQAIANGVKAIPPAIYRGLLGFFPAALLQRARYASGQSGAISLPMVAFTYGDAVAMTLGDVIVFRDEQAAQSDLRLWAHELTHVLQYQRWGTEGFASHYIKDRAGVEREAYANADRFVTWRGK